METSLTSSALGLGRRGAKQSAAMAKASSYAEWKKAAADLDQSTGRAAWRQVEKSSLYDHKLIRGRLEEIRRFRQQGDDHGLLYSLNEGLHGNLGGMGRSSMYARAASGTKRLVVEYVEEVVDALEHLANERSTDVSVEEKRDFFRRASLCYGHSALMLSGSGMFFFFHLGVLRALHREGLLPRVLSGSSGGALVAAVVGSHAPAERERVLSVRHFEAFVRDNRRWFGLPGPSVRREALDRHSEVLGELFPDLTFNEAQKRSGLFINVSVAPVDLHQRSRLLNAITSPNVYLRESIRASTAIPGFFPPVGLMAKNVHGHRQPYLPDRRWQDGSVSDDLPAKRLARLFGVNHYIVSQTNPHVLPFITDAKLDTDALSVALRVSQRTVREILNGAATVLQGPLRKSRQMTLLMNSALSVLNQDYLGDINILPSRPSNPLRFLSYCTPAEAERLVLDGERSTWPHLERIRIQTSISRTLDGILDRFGDGVRVPRPRPGSLPVGVAG